MAQISEESLFQAIKKDDIKAFHAMMEKAQCGVYRLGRFPVLSLMYLYKSRKLLFAYEEKFLKNTNFEQLREPVEISKKFAEKAGKCLRLYLDEVVSPLEMLLITDNVRRLKRNYPLTRPSTAVKERLKSIYSIKYSLGVKFEGDNIIIDRRPLSYREKRNVATITLCSVLAVTLIVGVPVTVDALIPKPVEGEVTNLSQIDFDSQKEYTLKNDIILPENYSVEKFNCKINGDGNKLILSEGANLGVLNGTLSGIIVQSSGEAIFTTLSETAVIENVTVNITADVVASESGALVAKTNYGTIDGVTVNISGKITAVSVTEDAADELTYGGIVLNNAYKYSSSNKVYRGTIKNCTVNYNQFVLVGESNVDSSYGGVAGINSGILQDCTVTGKITAETFDLAGACTVNNYIVSGVINEAELSQTSTDTGWNPIVCGIVVSNAHTVENCENRGNITAVSNCGEFEVQAGTSTAACAAGIAYVNSSTVTTPYIRNCKNLGDVECRAEYRNAQAAGVCMSSAGVIERCKNAGDVTLYSGNGFGIYGGGISSYSYGIITYSVNEGAVKASGSGAAYVGGISAHARSSVTYCFSDGDISVTALSVCAGGIFGFSEVAIDYFYKVYRGTAEYCISESKISVTATGDTPAYAGGIVGCVSELGLDSGESVFYVGGRVYNCYFTGECVTELPYFGNIVGACAANVYENNTFVPNSTESRNFDLNCYVQNSYAAFGATVKDDGSFISVEDKGATAATVEDIRNGEVYKSILSELDK